MSETKEVVPVKSALKGQEFNPTAQHQIDTERLFNGRAGDFSIQLNYHSFEQDEPIRGIYLGTTRYTCIDTATGELKEIEGAVFVTAKKNKKEEVIKMTCINCSCKFVDGLKRMPYAFAFEATMTGRKSKGDKSIAQFHIVEIIPA